MKYLAPAMLVGLGALVAAAPANAQVFTGFDLSGGYTRFSTDDLDLDAFAVRGTIHATRHLGGELEMNFGVGDDQFGGADVELDRNWGVFGRADLPFSDAGAVFVRVGYVDQEVTTTLAGVSTSDAEDGWAVGVGGEVFAFGLNGVRVDYTRYEFDSDDVDAFSISYVRRFGG